MTEKPRYGPANPHPLSQLKTELVWEGKYDEYGNRRVGGHRRVRDADAEDRDDR